MSAGVAVAVAVLTGGVFTSCEYESPKINASVNYNIDFSKIVEAIENGTLKKEQAVEKLTAAIDKMSGEQAAKIKALADLLGDVNKTLETKLDAIETIIKAQTLSLEEKFDLLQKAVDDGALKVDELGGKIADAIDNINTDLSTKLGVIKDMIESSSATVAEKLEAIEGMIDAQTLAMEDKMDLLEKAISGLPDYSSKLEAIETAISNLPDYSDKIGAIESAVKAIPDYKSAINAVNTALGSIKSSIEKIDIPDCSTVLDSIKTKLENAATSLADLQADVEAGNKSDAEAVEAIIGALDELKKAIEEIEVKAPAQDPSENDDPVQGGDDQNGNDEPSADDYIENGKNFGKGVTIEGVVWAPVNCGTDEGHPYGLLYQWGRRKGQGYNDGNDFTTESAPALVDERIEPVDGQKEEKKDNFYLSKRAFNNDWSSVLDDAMWNSGTNSNAVKTTNDPCPEGWRIPTGLEFESLVSRNTKKYPLTPVEYGGLLGHWLCGKAEYVEGMQDAIFLPAAGQRDGYDGECGERGLSCYYWSSNVAGVYAVFYSLLYNTESIGVGGGSRSKGQSVRCVKDSSAGNGNSGNNDPNTGNNDPEPGLNDYVSGGKNYGAGITVDGIIWAPVNCGIDDTHPLGLVYQWGRKYGQGYNDGNDYTTEKAPVFRNGPVTKETGQSAINMDIYYKFSSDWLDTKEDALWNNGTEASPVKTEYDPCPDGWRVPTLTEFTKLIGGKTKTLSDWSQVDGMNGQWLCGSAEFSEGMESAVFFPAAGSIGLTQGNAQNRNSKGCYWCSAPSGLYASFVAFNQTDVDCRGYNGRAGGMYVRCVKE